MVTRGQIKFSHAKHSVCFLTWLRQRGASLVAQLVKNLHAMKETWVGKILWRRKWQPTPACLPGKSHGQRNLEGYGPQGRKESDTTELLHHHCVLLYDRSRKQLQYSCLENPTDSRPCPLVTSNIHWLLQHSNKSLHTGKPGALQSMGSQGVRQD